MRKGLLIFIILLVLLAFVSCDNTPKVEKTKNDERATLILDHALFCFNISSGKSVLETSTDVTEVLDFSLSQDEYDDYNSRLTYKGKVEIIAKGIADGSDRIEVQFTGYTGKIEEKLKIEDDSAYKTISSFSLDGNFTQTYDNGPEKATIRRFVGKLNGEDVDITHSHVPGQL